MDQCISRMLHHERRVSAESGFKLPWIVEKDCSKIEPYIVRGGETVEGREPAGSVVERAADYTAQGFN
jgi:hypothetical protein